MKYGIVGSRRWKNVSAVRTYVNTLPKGSTVVSGGCLGVDTWAEECAKQRGLKTIILRPNLDGVGSRWDAIQRYYERNKKIADACDVLVAFPAEDRKGGTENTIKHALQLGKKVIIITRNDCPQCLAKNIHEYRIGPKKGNHLCLYCGWGEDLDETG